MMLPTYFTQADLIKYCGGQEEWAKDPRLTGAIAQILREEGYTQRFVRHNGAIERQWSRHWKIPNKRKRRIMDMDGKDKEELIERVKTVVRAG